MAERETLTVSVAGLTRHLPLFEVAPGVRIAIFNMLGDTQIVNASAQALADRLKGRQLDVIVTPEAKSIPLAHALSTIMDLPYVVLRKTYKGYMGEALSTDTVSITTGARQQLFLDEKDQADVRGAQVLLLDDVISTGSTLEGMKALMSAAEGQINVIATVFTEGDADWSDVVALGNLPVLTG